MAKKSLPRALHVRINTPEEVAVLREAKKLAVGKDTTLRQFIFDSLRASLAQAQQQPPTSQAA